MSISRASDQMAARMKSQKRLVWLHPEESGGYSVSVPSLPGVHSQGETVAEALEQISDALEVAIESYQAAGESVPWQSDSGEPSAPEVLCRWIEVDG